MPVGPIVPAQPLLHRLKPTSAREALRRGGSRIGGEREIVGGERAGHG